MVQVINVIIGVLLFIASLNIIEILYQAGECLKAYRLKASMVDPYDKYEYTVKMIELMESDIEDMIQSIFYELTIAKKEYKILNISNDVNEIVKRAYDGYILTLSDKNDFVCKPEYITQKLIQSTTVKLSAAALTHNDNLRVSNPVS